MTKTMTAALAALMLTGASAAMAQEAVSTAPAPTAPPAIPVTLPTLPGVELDPTCGERASVAAMAVCVVTTQAAMQQAADAYDAAFASQGWHAAAGEGNATIYVKRRDGGGCDGLASLAFANGSVAAPAAPAYFAFAAMPGDVCATPAAGSAEPATAPTTPPAQ